MKKGGYQIIDLKGVKYTSGTKKTDVEHPWFNLEGRNGKRTVVSGLVIGAAAYPDLEMVFLKAGTKYTGETKITGGTIKLEIEEDGVKATYTADQA